VLVLLPLLVVLLLQDLLELPLPPLLLKKKKLMNLMMIWALDSLTKVLVL
jgi:hypothetical protein